MAISNKTSFDQTLHNFVVSTLTKVRIFQDGSAQWVSLSNAHGILFASADPSSNVLVRNGWNFNRIVGGGFLASFIKDLPSLIQPIGRLGTNFPGGFLQHPAFVVRIVSHHIPPQRHTKVRVSWISLAVTTASQVLGRPPFGHEQQNFVGGRGILFELHQGLVNRRTHSCAKGAMKTVPCVSLADRGAIQVTTGVSTGNNLVGVVLSLLFDVGQSVNRVILPTRNRKPLYQRIIWSTDECLATVTNFDVLLVVEGLQSHQGSLGKNEASSWDGPGGHQVTAPRRRIGPAVERSTE